MEFEDFKNKIYTCFVEEFTLHFKNKGYIWWHQYLNNLNLGIIHIAYTRYKVIDEKKWTLNKIKYGF
jgi:hypothetical protein